MTKPTDTFTSLDEIEALATAFEACSIAPAAFSHREHLAVCLHYLTRLGYARTVVAMREGLFKFLRHHGLDGYNETITLFWLKRLAPDARAGRLRAKRLATINRVIADNANSQLLFSFYSRDRVMSDLAKREWVEPDLPAWRKVSRKGAKRQRAQRGRNFFHE